MTQSKGNLFMLSAPSGAGKSSLYKALLKQDENVRISVSHTTRSARKGEEHGREYYFIDVPTFQQMITDGDFFEYAQVFDNYYGTSRSAIMAMLNQGLDVILEIDWQGARQIRKLYPDALGIFVLPPSTEELERRLCDRGTDTDDVIQKRMAKAVNEMSHYDEYDFLLINDDFDDTLAKMQSIIQAMRTKRALIAEKHADLIDDLLSL
ncbi:guanylate kinase [Marinomonas agarivorans]|nr:guanylate kinase [Marinomonas agarivorans]